MQARAASYLVTAVILLLLLWFSSPFSVVPSGHRGVLTTFGKVDEVVLGEGIHFRWPFAQTIHKVDTRILKGIGQGDAASRDMQQVHTSVALNYRIEPSHAAEVFQNIGIYPSVEESVGGKIIEPAVQESVKAVTAQFTAEELIAKREIVKTEIQRALKARLERRGIAVEEFNIVNFQFTKSFNDAIEAKTTAEQLKLKAERDLQRIRVEAEQAVVQAKAQADALAVQRQQVTSELLRLREIENQKAAIDKWNGVLPSVTSDSVPFIQIPAARPR